ncbi:carboxylesterase/lipase family protein [Alloalcanivorax mobilis]|uniref:carboxylesterase/lipase family protein n=1 Tax=Alloalcanivorax mobilis TaxID=2019569 RepID=UPI000C768802|nr:carboxylesterase family protein [Alloalcanivorax mobilis]
MKVVIPQGAYQGLSANGVSEFRGVPYALPPLAERRFKAPQPLPPSSDQQRADRYPLPSVQPRNPLMGVEDSGEDCLYMNLWVPEGEGPFPVMLWYHGGGYTAGSVSQALYNGARLAATRKVVVVHAAYRLGAHGFADFSAIAPELQADTNLGLRDQIAALEWVNRHIEAFAGRADQVTIFGESAGGFSVASLMATPRARPLFQRAIVQSGGGDFVLAPEESRRITEAFVEALPGEGGAAERIRQADPKAWLAAQAKAQRMLAARGLRDTTPQFSMVFLPTVDGDLLPRVPVDAIAAGEARDIELLAGACRDEWNFFQYAGPMAGFPSLDELRAFDDEEILRRFERALPGHGERMLAYYRATVTPHAERSNMDWFSAMETDRLFRVPTVRLLDAQARHRPADTRGYQFTFESTQFGVPMGACHVVDVPFVFGITDTPVGQFFTGGTDQARALAERVQQVWGDFAHGRGADWPAWSEQRQVHQFGPGGEMARLLDDDAERLWEAVIPKA